jgi:hypothetical protein
MMVFLFTILACVKHDPPLAVQFVDSEERHPTKTLTCL